MNQTAETCSTCKTPILLRRIPFGKAGYVEALLCECQATRMVLKYKNSEFTDGAKPAETKKAKKAPVLPGMGREPGSDDE